ncbi:MATE family efflux transporter [Euryhalocaulis caribicus]|uniref:MATE family efflux transporter n=1 Tax=Euryhalocaulis caribicus TaxID=1161401 RepID=UPI0003A5B80A|nr:MATE family efflux transporter [Euryhalocaulis caribicus]
MSNRNAISVSWRDEFRATFRLAWPLIIAQMAQMALTTTDVIMMGWLGPEPLAAGTIAMTLVHPVMIGGIGLLTATAPMISQAIGAGRYRLVRRTVRPGLWISVLLSLIGVPLLLNGGPLLRLLGQEPHLTVMAGDYLLFAAWAVPAAILLTPPKSLISARGDTPVILGVTLFGVVLNALSNYALMFGNFGFPRMELQGAGVSTTLTAWAMFAMLLVYITRHRRYRRYMVLARIWKPDWPQFREIFRIGTPIAMTMVAEVGIFAAAAIMMGWLGVNELAAHAVAVQCAAIAFMVPFGLSQATTIRVGLAHGAGSPERVRKAGYASLALAAGFAATTCTLFLIAPVALVSLYLDPGDPANQASVALAASYLVVAGLFQFVDAGQVVSAAALRGLSDTRIPMMVAIAGYWLVGAPLGYVCAFTFGMRGVGIWLGLAAGLAFVAVVLTTRFSLRDRLAARRTVQASP